MKKLFLTTLIIGVSFWTQAQEIKNFEVKNFEGLIRIKGPSNGLTIEGYKGKEVIISAEKMNYNMPAEANGLKLVTAGGLDNTGLAVSANESVISLVKGLDANGKEIVVKQRVLDVSIPSDNKMYKSYTIKVPQKSDLSFSENNYYKQSKGELIIDKLAGELEVKCYGCNLNVKNFEGNIIANNSLEAKMNIQFTNLDETKVSSINAFGNVDITMPSSTKAYLALNTHNGNVFTDFDLKKVETRTFTDTFNGVPLSTLNLEGLKFTSDTVVFSGSSSTVTLTANGVNIKEGKSGVKEINGKSQKTIIGKGFSGANDGSQYSASVRAARNISKSNYEINGGGALVSITSFNGNIYLRKN